MKWFFSGASLLLVGIAVTLAAQAPSQQRSPAEPVTGAAKIWPEASRRIPKSKNKAEDEPTGGNQRKIACKTPENAALCYWTHGRLMVYNGNPSFRIWKIGTRRVLGVYNGPGPIPPGTLEDENPEFPAELNRAYELDNRPYKKATGMMWSVPPPVFADFEVCPLSREKKGWMQPVCIQSAKNIFVEPDN